MITIPDILFGFLVMFSCAFLTILLCYVIYIIHSYFVRNAEEKESLQTRVYRLEKELSLIDYRLRLSLQEFQRRENLKNKELDK